MSNDILKAAKHNIAVSKAILIFIGIVATANLLWAIACLGRLIYVKGVEDGCKAVGGTHCTEIVETWH